MGSICNGLALTKLRSFGSGFMIFSDFVKPSVRLSAIMELPVIYIFTHDSIGVGEDGPTHQPVEQLIGLRAIPGLTVFRPCDANEVAEAWRHAIEAQHEPSCMILSRQNLPTLDRTKFAPASGLRRGAYVLADAKPGTTPDVILMATGSEVGLVVEIYEKLAAEGIAARVVSMPSWELFEKQDDASRESVLGALHRPAWHDYWNEDLRRLGAPQGTPGEVRLHRGKRLRGCQGAARAEGVIIHAQSAEAA
jgi:transketolase